MRLLIVLLFGLALLVSFSGTSQPAAAYPCYYYYYGGYYYYYCYYSYYYSYPYYYYPYGYSSYYYSYSQPKYELKIDTSPTGIAPVTGAGTYTSGTTASFSITMSTVSSAPGSRYVFSYWSGDYSGIGPSGSVTVSKDMTIVANYKLQHYLTVSVEPTITVSSSGQGWYDQGTDVALSAVPQMASGGDGVRYVFTGWAIDGKGVAGNPPIVNMNSPHQAVAHYKTQYYLTVVSPNGVTQGSAWYDAGSTAVFSVTSPIEAGFGTQLVFTSWSGDASAATPSASVVMDKPRTVLAGWRTDSTVLNYTIAGGSIGAFLVGVALTAVVFRARGGGMGSKPLPPTPSKRFTEPESAAIPKKKRAPLKKATPPIEEPEAATAPETEPS